jgi:hypothetical protein
VGLLSSQTKDEFFGEATRASRAQKERRGVHRALLEAHIPFDIISEDALALTADELLSRYDAIVIPDYPTLGADGCAALDAYVAAGGGLVTTFDTATSRPDGTPGTEIGLASIGASTIIARHRGEAALRSSYVRPAEGETEFTFPNNKFVAIDQAFNVIDVKPSAAVPMTFLPASLYGPPELCYWEVESDHPGVVTNSYEKGRTAYIPWPIGTLFYELSIPEYRDILQRAIEHVSSAPPQVTTSAPAQVEVVVQQQPDTHTTLVHLINYTGHDGRAFHDPIEIHEIQVSLRTDSAARALTTAYSTRLDREVPLQNGGDGTVSFTLPRLASFDLITLT